VLEKSDKVPRLPDRDRRAASSSRSCKVGLGRCRRIPGGAFGPFRSYMRGGYTSVRYATECVIDEILYDDDTTVHPITEEYARMLDLMY